MNRRKGNYVGSVFDEKWWKRYVKDTLFARSNGDYWYDDQAVSLPRILGMKKCRNNFSNSISSSLFVKSA